VDKIGVIHLTGGYRSIYGGGNSRISLFEASTKVLKIFNMLATIARKGDRVQLEQSDMRVALNMAKMAKQSFLRAAMEETKYLIKKPCAEVREQKKQGVEVLGHKNVKAAIQ
jgi:hypothetical protein